jgi:SET domain-containing protein
VDKKLQRFKPDSAGHAASRAPYTVKASGIHGLGVFARRRIPAGGRIVEYRGERITWREALRRAEAKDGPISHTFFFTLNDGRIIDGGSHGNDARFINHSCEPNCEAIEHENGRVYIRALTDIARGEELSYNYALVYEERHTPAVKRAFVCHCGAANCTGSMLRPKSATRPARVARSR